MHPFCSPEHFIFMANSTKKIGLGGGCHWCTEAVFQQLRGVERVEQGWIRSSAPDDAFSEAIVVHFDPRQIPLAVLLEVHLRTHASTSAHALRGKYRSAVYWFDAAVLPEIDARLAAFAAERGRAVVTRALPFVAFRENEETYRAYYRKRPNAPFCRRYIDPKLDLLRREFSEHFAAR